jgi:hypothetical protein
VVDTIDPVDTDTWAPDDEYERRVQQGPTRGALLEPRDAYVSTAGPDPDAAGRDYSGLRPTLDTGTRVVLSHGHGTRVVRAGSFFPVRVPGAGADDPDAYEEQIATCHEAPVRLGDSVAHDPGDLTGRTRQGVSRLIAQDSGAYWDAACACVRGSAFSTSPRLVAVPVFSPEEYDTQERPGGRFTARIIKILGLFVEPMEGDDIVGRITPIPAEYDASAGALMALDPTSFLYTVMLVR